MSEERNMANRIYLAALFLWLIGSALFPTWIGRHYMINGAEGWHENGVFALQGGGGDPWYTISPLWRPPSPMSGQAVVRWPLQAMPGSNSVRVIELSWGANVFRASLGVIVFGLALRLWHWWIGNNRRDATSTIAWFVSLWLGCAAICVVAIVFATMGSILEYPIVQVGMGLGLLVGLAHGLWSIAVRSRTER